MTQTDRINEFLERRIAQHRRLNDDTYAAAALALATVVALLWANIGGSYERFWSTQAGFQVGSLRFGLDLHDWVDEGLMTAFFFMVGLDVRRELTMGELRHKERAVLPLAAALGGLLVPTAIFLVITRGHPWASAWGAVISTDTAFAIGMLGLVGARNAPRLRVFLLALAVIDDIAALLVIAIVYSGELRVAPLGVAAVALGVIWLLQHRGVWQVGPYLACGVVVWGALFSSGVHATLSGVLVALLMPVYQPRKRDFDLANGMFHLFRQAPGPNMARTVRRSLSHAIPLNQKLSAALPPYVNYLVVPLFAIANAGVPLSWTSLRGAFASNLTWAVIAGLVVGKVAGVSLGAFTVSRLLPASRLPGLDLPRISGVAGLCGIGFTISLLVVNLALDDPAQQDEARIGVLTASVVALALGWALFRLGDRFAPLPPPAGEHLPRPVEPAHDHVRGPADAPVTLVVYAAMNPLYRQFTAGAVRELVATHPDDLRVVYRHRATSTEENTAALALEAAAAQGRFDEMYDALIASQADIDSTTVEELARHADLDVDELARRMDRGIDQSRIDDDDIDLPAPEDGPAAPVLYINGNRARSPLNSWNLARQVEHARDAATHGQ